jgi:hypothetical protein
MNITQLNQTNAMISMNISKWLIFQFPKEISSSFFSEKADINFSDFLHTQDINVSKLMFKAGQSIEFTGIAPTAYQSIEKGYYNYSKKLYYNHQVEEAISSPYLYKGLVLNIKDGVYKILAEPDSIDNNWSNLKLTLVPLSDLTITVSRTEPLCIEVVDFLWGLVQRSIGSFEVAANRRLVLKGIDEEMLDNSSGFEDLANALASYAPPGYKIAVEGDVRMVREWWRKGLPCLISAKEGFKIYLQKHHLL